MRNAIISIVLASLCAGCGSIQELHDWEPVDCSNLDNAPSCGGAVELILNQTIYP